MEAKGQVNVAASREEDALAEVAAAAAAVEKLKVSEL